MRKPRIGYGAALVLMLVGSGALSSPHGPAAGDPPPVQTVAGQWADNVLLNGQWADRAISYSGYRAGQSPDSGVHPTPQQIAEDMEILQKNWKLIRVYGSGPYGESILRVIRQKGIKLKVMLGAWLGKEPGNETSNARQIESCIRLANEYREIVVAVNVGNEIFVEWTVHSVPERNAIRYLKQVKAGVSVPVTVADNYAWWRDDGERIAAHLDFITVHTYPLWEKKDIDQGMSYTIENIESVRRALPDKPIVIGEAGWATYTEGPHHVYRAGDEQKQRRYYRELMAWARKNRVTTFFFDAFDEPWKGPGTEGHWGLFTADRKAKPAALALYPELKPDGPTSPDYSTVPPPPPGPELAIVFRKDLAARIGTGVVVPLGAVTTVMPVRQPAEVADGESALKLRHSGADWGGVYFRLDAPFDASAYAKLVVSLKIPIRLGYFEVKVEGPATKAATLNVMDYPSKKSPHGWRTFSIPLTAFAGVDFSKLEIIGFWNPKASPGSGNKYTARDIVIDGLHFE